MSFTSSMRDRGKHGNKRQKNKHFQYSKSSSRKQQQLFTSLLLFAFAHFRKLLHDFLKNNIIIVVKDDSKTSTETLYSIPTYRKRPSQSDTIRIHNHRSAWHVAPHSHSVYYNSPLVCHNVATPAPMVLLLLLSPYVASLTLILRTGFVFLGSHRLRKRTDSQET